MPTRRLRNQPATVERQVIRPERDPDGQGDERHGEDNPAAPAKGRCSVIASPQNPK